MNKEKIIQRVESLRADLLELSHKIHSNPELVGTKFKRSSGKKNCWFGKAFPLKPLIVVWKLLIGQCIKEKERGQ